MIYVTSLDHLETTIDTHRPARLISLLPLEEIDEVVARPDYMDEDQHLKIGVHDISEEIPDLIAPGREHAAMVVAFIEAWDKARQSGAEDGPLVVHCRMGISRSGAAAFIALCMLSEPGQEHAIAQEMRRRGAHIQPNPLLVKHADDILGREGRMIAAVETLGRGTGYNEMPWLEMALWTETDEASPS